MGQAGRRGVDRRHAGAGGSRQPGRCAVHQHLDLFVRFGDNLAAPQLRQARGNDLSCRLADVPIEDLDLSVRALNCLKANEITKVGQLVGMKQEELLTLRNFGQKSLDEIKEKLVQRGLVTPEELNTLFQPMAR